MESAGGIAGFEEIGLDVRRDDYEDDDDASKKSLLQHATTTSAKVGTMKSINKPRNVDEDAMMVMALLCDHFGGHRSCLVSVITRQSEKHSASGAARPTRHSYVDY